MSESTKRKIKTTIVVVAWGLLAGAGMAILHTHSARPGDSGSRPLRWPVDSKISLVADRPTLLVFLDSRCPCARATIAELEIVLAQCGDRAATRIVTVGTEEREADWTNDRVWAALAKLPGVEMQKDHGGREASRFGVATSGQVLLFRPDGRLVFQGGITAARDHEGANYGRDAVIGWILGDDVGLTAFPVFGCPIEPIARHQEHVR